MREVRLQRGRELITLGEHFVLDPPDVICDVPEVAPQYGILSLNPPRSIASNGAEQRMERPIEVVDPV